MTQCSFRWKMCLLVKDGVMVTGGQWVYWPNCKGPVSYMNVGYPTFLVFPSSSFERKTAVSAFEIRTVRPMLTTVWSPLV